MGYNFKITDIEWDAPSDHALPDDEEVVLPSWLVCCDDELDDEEWEEVINEELFAKHGYRGKKFGWTLNE